MKICKKCGSKVPASKWAYKDDLCLKCYNQREYYERPEVKKRIDTFEKMSKEELIGVVNDQERQIHSRDMIIKYQIQRNVSKTSQIRHFRLRIKKIRDGLDYLLEHPFSMDNSYRGSRK